MILLGSRALALRAPSLLQRQPKDFDFVATQAEIDSWMAENRDKTYHTHRARLVQDLQDIETGLEISRIIKKSCRMIWIYSKCFQNKEIIQKMKMKTLLLNYLISLLSRKTIINMETIYSMIFNFKNQFQIKI